MRARFWDIARSIASDVRAELAAFAAPFLEDAPAELRAGPRDATATADEFRRARLRAIRAMAPLMLAANTVFALAILGKFGANLCFKTLLWVSVVLGVVILSTPRLVRLPGMRGEAKPRRSKALDPERDRRALRRAFALCVVLALAWLAPPLIYLDNADGGGFLVLGAMIGAISIGAAFVCAPAPRLAALFVLTACGPALALAAEGAGATGADARSDLGLSFLAAAALLPLLTLQAIKTGYESFAREFCARRSLEDRNATIDMLLRDFGEQSADWLWQIDARLRLTFASTRMAESLRLSPDRRWRSLVRALEAAGADRAALAELLRKLRARKAFSDVLVQVGSNEAPCCWFAFSASPVRDREGRFIGFRGVARNVTETVRGMRDLARARDAAEAASAAKSRFLAMASHELRTPMNAILGFSDVVASDRLSLSPPEAYRDYAANIHAAGNHLLGLINDLLDAALIEEGRLRLEDEWIDAEALARDAVDLCAETLRDCAAEAVLHPSMSGLALRVDRRRVLQILVNLISNAAKYGRPNAPILIEARSAGEGVEILVRDRGEGLNADQLQAVFEPFARGAGTPRAGAPSSGLGLGLPIARALAEAHGGALRLENRPRTEPDGAGDATMAGVDGLDGVLSLPAARVDWRVKRLSA